MPRTYVAILVALLVVSLVTPPAAAGSSATYVGGSYDPARGAASTAALCTLAGGALAGVGGVCRLPSGSAAFATLLVDDAVLTNVQFQYVGYTAGGALCGKSGVATNSVFLDTRGCASFDVFPQVGATTGRVCLGGC